MTAKAIPGFTYDETAANVTSGTIAGDGSLVLELYYTRNSYTLTLDFNGESMKQAVKDENYHTLITEVDVPDQTVSVKYGQPLAEALTGITSPVKAEEGYEIWDETLGQWVEIDPTYEDVPFENAFPGYTFRNWDGIADTMPAEDLTLTAQWTPIEVTVTYISDYSNEPGTRYSETYSYGDVIPLPYDASAYGFTKEGYFIPGWSYAYFNDDGAPISVELVLVNGYYTYDGYSVTEGSESYGVPAGEVYIYASWREEATMSTITFNGNGGMGTMENQLIDGSGHYYVALARNKFTREGYRFIGWTETQNYDPDTDWLYDDGAMAPQAWNPNTTLYAQWEKIE